MKSTKVLGQSQATMTLSKKYLENQEDYQDCSVDTQKLIQEYQNE